MDTTADQATAAAAAATAAADVDELRDALLLATLPNVVFDGWSEAALKDGARALGLSDFDAARAFPGGVADLVSHFAAWADRRMLEELQVHDLAGMKVRQRVHLAVKTRLVLLEPYRDAVRRAIALSALPSYCALAPTALYKTVDAVWFAAGDTATDFNFYTKRALLAGVVTATTLYWLEDASDDCADTWAFLDRRIGDVLNVGKAVGTVGKVATYLNHLPSPNRFMRRLREAVGMPGEMKGGSGSGAAGAAGGVSDGAAHPSA